MGKLEILDTPNGKIAQQLVEAGYPLFVSSRAAGDVNEKTHEVEIAQIFTYDIVCTPGFAEAKLERVNENLNPATVNYLNESVTSQKLEKEKSKKYKVITEGVTVCDVETEAPLNEKCMELKNKPYKISELAKPLLEEDEEEFKLPEADITADGNKIDNSDNKDDKSEEKNSEEKSQPTDEDKAKKRALILNITSEDTEGESSEEPSEDEDKTEKRADILDIEGQSDEADSEEIFDIDDDEKTDDEKSDDEKTEEKETDECGETSTAKAEKVLDKTEKDMEKFQKLLNNLEKKESIKEQIVAHYPFSISLSEENFVKNFNLQKMDFSLQKMLNK